MWQSFFSQLIQSRFLNLVTGGKPGWLAALHSLCHYQSMLLFISLETILSWNKGNPSSNLLISSEVVLLCVSSVVLRANPGARMPCPCGAVCPAAALGCLWEADSAVVLQSSRPLCLDPSDFVTLAVICTWIYCWCLEYPRSFRWAVVLATCRIPLVRCAACRWGVKAELCRSKDHLPGSARKEGVH